MLSRAIPLDTKVLVRRLQLVLCIMLAGFPLLCLLQMAAFMLPGGFNHSLEMFGALGPGERRGVLTVLLEVWIQKLLQFLWNGARFASMPAG